MLCWTHDTPSILEFSLATHKITVKMKFFFFFFCALQVNLDKMFWSKPCSLALPLDSPLRVNEPDYQGFKRFIFKLMLFYSKQSKSIRGANVVYRRIVSQVDKPLIYEG